MPAPALSVPLKDVMQFFERQFVRLNTLLTKSALLFIAVIAVESCAISAVTYWSINYFFSTSGPETFSDWSPRLLFVAAVLFAPILETLVFQSLVFWAVKKTRIQGCYFWLAMTTPFALAHSQFSIARAVAAGVVGGLYLGVCYVLARRRYSFVYAFVITASAHSLRNIIVVVMNHIFSN